MDEKITVKVKVFKCTNSKCRKLAFSHVLEQYLDRCIKDHYKKHLVYGMRSTNQFMKAIIQLMMLFEYEGQGHQI